MALSVASMVLAIPVVDCELIVAAAETWSPDTRLSQPRDIGMLVGISFLKLYSMEVVGLSPGSLCRSGASRRQEREPEYNSKLSTPFY
jgi:hypothetical protein